MVEKLLKKIRHKPNPHKIQYDYQRNVLLFLENFYVGCYKEELHEWVKHSLKMDESQFNKFFERGLAYLKENRFIDIKEKDLIVMLDYERDEEWKKEVREFYKKNVLTSPLALERAKKNE